LQLPGCVRQNDVCVDANQVCIDTHTKCFATVSQIHDLLLQTAI